MSVIKTYREEGEDIGRGVCVCVCALQVVNMVRQY